MSLVSIMIHFELNNVKSISIKRVILYNNPGRLIDLRISNHLRILSQVLHLRFFLDSNNLEFISDKIFHNNLNLESICICDNFLTSIPKDLF